MDVGDRIVVERVQVQVHWAIDGLMLGGACRSSLRQPLLRAAAPTRGLESDGLFPASWINFLYLWEYPR